MDKNKLMSLWVVSYHIESSLEDDFVVTVAQDEDEAIQNAKNEVASFHEVSLKDLESDYTAFSAYVYDEVYANQTVYQIYAVDETTRNEERFRDK